MTMTPADFDRLLMGWRIYCRDYEVTDEDQQLLAALEEVGGNREVGGQQAWQPDGWDEDLEDPPNGEAGVTA